MVNTWNKKQMRRTEERYSNVLRSADVNIKEVPAADYKRETRYLIYGDIESKTLAIFPAVLKYEGDFDCLLNHLFPSYEEFFALGNCPIDSKQLITPRISQPRLLNIKTCLVNNVCCGEGFIIAGMGDNSDGIGFSLMSKDIAETVLAMCHFSINFKLVEPE